MCMCVYIAYFFLFPLRSPWSYSISEICSTVSPLSWHRPHVFVYSDCLNNGKGNQFISRGHTQMAGFA